MKKKLSYMCIISICNIIFSRGALAIGADFVQPFISANIGISVDDYDLDVAEKAGIPYSTFGSQSYKSLTYGLNTGIKFLDNSYEYHPGLNIFWEQIKDPIKLSVATGYDTITFKGNSYHTLMGVEFDNYFRVAHNIKRANYKCDDFFVLGLDIGKIKSRYELLGSHVSEDSIFYGIKLEFLTEIKNGVGASVSIRKLYTKEMDGLQSILSSRIGIRYTF